MSIHRKIIPILTLFILFSVPVFMGGNAQADDAYEPNDKLGTAWHPGYNWVRTWLSDINGLGVQSDDDWYRIDVDPGVERIQVDCRFIHAEGDIDIGLYDSTETLLAESITADDDEFIDHTISSGGTYYIKVSYGNAGNTYDLRWDDLTEDAYEDNDTMETAWHPGYNWERTWLTGIDGFGVQVDDDWYRVDVDPGSVRVQVDSRFTHAEGDVNIALYDSTGTLLASSEGTTDNEFIDHLISGGGTYYVRVYSGNAGNMYDLWWDDLSEDAYEENDDWGTAWHPGYNWDRTWLSDIGGLGIQADDDWYRIDVDMASERIQVDCQFTDADGDIDIGLYDSTGTPVEASESVTDNELIDVAISGGGTYYIRVHFSNVGNAYDLRWDDFSTGSTALISDFDADGVPDIFWRNGTSGGNALWYMDTNGTTVKSWTSMPNAGTSWQAGGVGDFDADGVPDILWRNGTSGGNAIWYMEANGTAVKGFVGIPNAGTSWEVGGVGDFDVDGVPDILWRNGTSGGNAIWYMEANGTAVKGFVGIPNAGTSWQVGGVADFDADGVPDILWRNGTSGGNAIWYMDTNGTTVKSWTGVPNAGTSWQVGKIADFDGDGVPDIFWRNGTSGGNAIWYMDTNGTTVKSWTSVPNAGTSWDIGG